MHAVRTRAVQGAAGTMVLAFAGALPVSFVKACAGVAGGGGWSQQGSATPVWSTLLKTQSWRHLCTLLNNTRI